MQLKDKIDKNIKELLKTQFFGVLATTKDSGVHTSIVAFISEENYESIFFSTLKASRKYDNILHNPHVSLLVDNRNNLQNDLTDAIAVSFVGSAKIVDETEMLRLKERMLQRHRNFKDFLRSPNTAIISIRVDQIDYVSKFQNVITLRAHAESFELFQEKKA